MRIQHTSARLARGSRLPCVIPDLYQCVVVLRLMVRLEVCHMIENAVQILLKSQLAESCVAKRLAGAVLGLDHSICGK